VRISSLTAAKIFFIIIFLPEKFTFNPACPVHECFEP